MPFMMKPNGRIETVSARDLPKFVAKGYGVEYVSKKFVDGEMRSKSTKKECIPCEVTGEGSNLEKAREAYEQVFGKPVPNAYKNKLEWINEKVQLEVI